MNKSRIFVCIPAAAIFLLTAGLPAMAQKPPTKKPATSLENLIRLTSGFTPGLSRKAVHELAGKHGVALYDLCGGQIGFLEGANMDDTSSLRVSYLYSQPLAKGERPEEDRKAVIESWTVHQKYTLLKKHSFVPDEWRFEEDTSTKP